VPEHGVAGRIVGIPRGMNALGFRRGLAPLAAIGGLFLAQAGVPVEAAAPPGKTLGFVITTWNIASYETRFVDECPRGLNVGYDEYWWRGLSKEDRARYTDNGLKSRLERYFNAIRRGPNGEDVCMNPTAVKDPPLLLVEGEKAYGMDLDGKDGVAAGRSCPHREFTGVDGTSGVDNQLYRLLGCVYGFRSYGQVEANENENRKSNGKGMTLVEVTGVDDTRNDPEVTVNFYRAIDLYTLDGSGRFLPHGSYRIDTHDGKPRYASSVRGKISNGVLITEPGDVNLPFYGNYTYQNRLFRDLRIRMTLSPDGNSAEGLAAGYFGVKDLMFYVGSIGPIQSTTISNCPSIHVAANEIADGHPDPKTGDCTTLSSAFVFKAVAAFVVHGDQRTAATGRGLLDRIKEVFQ